MANVLIKIITKFDPKGVKQAQSDIKDIGGILGKAVGGLGIAFGAKEILDFGVQTFKAAEQARVASSAFNSLSGGVNIARLNLQAMSRATRGLASDTEQMQIANQLLGMNIASTDAELEKVVGVSRRLGKEFRGLGTREAAEEFAIMVSNMSVARLDSFGIASGAVRERINELLATTEDMTREQAFFQATMEEAEETLARLGPELNTTSDEVARLGAEWANFQVFLGKTVEDSGAIKSFFSDLADGFVTLRNLLGDESLPNQIEAIKIEIGQTEAELAKAQARSNDFIFGPLWRVDIPNYEQKLKDLQGELNSLLNVEGELDRRAQGEQARLQAAIASEEKVAENVAKRAESAKRLAEVQEEFSREVIDLQADTQDRLSDSQEKFNEDQEKAADDHGKRLVDIRKQADKDQVRAARKLQKDLSKVDSNLKKSLIKQQIDEDKAIAKAQQNAAKDETRTRREKQIDAAGDERLFQFELRRLAADGNGIAIQEALERRAIEQEIAAEKAEFEKTTEREKKDDQIQSIREEGAERRLQLQQQAAERRADLEERNREDAESRAERIAEQLADESEAFTKRKVDLQEFFAERNVEIRDGEQEGLREIAEALTQAEELTNTQLDQMVALAAEFGPKFGEAFADGMTKSISENLKIDEAIASASDIGAGAGPLPIAAGGETRSGGGVPIFQEGGMVERSGLAFVDRGERIIPADQASAAGGITININAPVFGVEDLDRKLTDWGQMVVDNVAGALN